jgi:hypothetical protein
MKRIYILLVLLFFSFSAVAQDYFYGKQGPFNDKIPSPEQFLGYSIGEYNTRHDRVLAYFRTLESLSYKDTLTVY